MSRGTTDHGFIPFETTTNPKSIGVEDAGKVEGQVDKAISDEVATEMAHVQSQQEDLERHVIMEGESGVEAVSAMAEKDVGDTERVAGPPPEWVKPAEQNRLSQTAKPISAARKARRERRLAEGKLGQKNAARATESKAKQAESTSTQQLEQDEGCHDEEDADQVQSVLARLDKDLGGPSIIKAQQSRAVKLAAKSIEKKRKLQQLAAHKLETERHAAAEAERSRKKRLEPWQRDKSALKQKFGEKAWAPRKRLSPDSLDGIRALHASDPGTYTTKMLSQHFEVTPEAIRRILKSKWKPSPEEVEERRERWEKRGVKKWREMSEVHGMKPPKKWRVLHGVPNPKLEGRKKWEDPHFEKKGKVINRKTGKKERWRNLGKTRGGVKSVSLADRL
ncbi:hypothetical protein CERZMDRAFT_95295 [Cercospora zeae-maydis SCOH1-5]|uniref:Required for respiratory growth protein 9, mitochondrial n=1 Tax=Cercospora zeae-maydis SCOH1-5 TaxID=717836 RepID=A0A6A6FN73_9PEZI|nr:hypothetical protein CERZMDRAFT_95295 [Cercospora zeae-maydis SCOH1-5]